MTTDADVIIAGAGPAGSIAAYELASRGISVLILEKTRFPRYKVCGAGLTHKILQEIPFDVSEVFERTVNTIIFSSGFRDVFSRVSAEPLIYCTMRDKLDAFLLDKAVAAGARVLFGEKADGVRQEKDFTEVITRSGSHRSRIVIGADGASSAIGRSVGLRENIMKGLAWEAELTVDAKSLETFSTSIFLDWGAFPGGYGWMFPKTDHFSIGVGGPASLSKTMIDYYNKFIDYLEKGASIDSAPFGIRVHETRSLKSWPIPVRVRASRFHLGRVLVAGDAGGLTDPLTGEGIYYAVRSGKLAADAARSYLEGASPTLDAYTESVNDQLMNELTEANRIKYIFNTAPKKIHRFVRDSDRGWRAFGKVLRGERCYADVRKGFGKWKFLWGLACRVAVLVSDAREKHFSAHGFK